MQYDNFQRKRENMRYSIIVPVFNAGEKLHKSIGSVINQTFSDWELIAVDDGSTDNSLSILTELSQREPRIKVYHQENAGPGAARNHAICKSHGEYITFLDADDYWDDDFLECINGVRADIVFYDVIEETVDGAVVNTMCLSKFSDASKQDLLCMQMTGKFPWGMVKAVKSSLLDVNEAGFLDINVGEEAIFSFKVLNAASSFGFIEKPIYHYVKGTEGQHKKGDVDPWSEVVLAIKGYLQEKNIYQTYESTVNSFAVRALCISLYRISNSETMLEALSKMKNRIDAYEKLYDFSNINLTALDKSSLIILRFAKLKMVFPIYMASILRKKKLRY